MTWKTLAEKGKRTGEVSKGGQGMKALVLGGAGGMGQAVARNLVRHEEIKEVILGDLYPDPGRLHEKLRGNERVRLVKMDVMDHQDMVEKMRGVDVVVHCAGPFYKTALPVARAAVEARVNYIDICDDYEAAAILYESEIDKIARDVGVTVLTGMGSDPGTNNILARFYADKLDKVEEIDLYWVVSIADIEHGAAWDHSLHMVTGQVPQYLEGKLQYVEGGSGDEFVKFLDPLGECLVSYVGHPQPFTVPRYIKGVKTVIVKGALIPTWVHKLIKEQKETGFLSKEPVQVGGKEVIPYDLTFHLWKKIPEGRDRGPMASGMKIVVKGEREGKRVTYTADIVGRTAAGTGLPAAIAAWIFCTQGVTVKGVVAPEGCIEPESFLKEFVNRGARIHQTEKVESILSF